MYVHGNCIQICCIGVNVNHNATHSPSLARKNKSESDSRLLKNSEGNRDDEWYFCRGQEADIALFFQETRIRKIRKVSEENWSTIARNRAITSNEPWKAETNKVDRNAPITSKQLFPKRSAKTIDGTEKPKILSKFVKHSARYNEFGYKISINGHLIRGNSIVSRCIILQALAYLFVISKLEHIRYIYI